MTALPPTSTTTAGPAASPAGAPRWWHPAVCAVVGLGLFGLSLLLLGDPVEQLPGWEVDLFRAVNDLPDALRWLLWPIMQLGYLGVYVVGGAGVYALTRRVRPALATAVAVLAAWLAAWAVKQAVERARPGALLDGVDVREGGVDGYGYASGHTSVAFALAAVLTFVLPGRWRLVPLPLALAVGVARIYHGVHLPLDVLGGAGLGLLCGVAAAWAFGATHARLPTPDRSADQPAGSDATL